MAVTARPLIPSKTAEAAQTSQYVAQNVTTIIDKFTAVNYSIAAATISVHLVSANGAAGDANVSVKTKTLQPLETYTFPEVVGHVLAPGGFISTIASVGAAISIRASGREVT